MDRLFRLVDLFENNRNQDQAIPMEKYMKNHFPFLGIKSPDRKELMKQYFQESKLLKEPFQEEFVLELWAKNEREYQYAALDYIGKSIKKLNKDNLALMEYLITTKFWWDTVDTLAAGPVGKIAKDHPEVISQKINSWAQDENLWLRRTAILFQLKFKDQTNEDLLYEYIKQNAHSKEFFIQKGIGWALREYSKTNPDSVRNFIENHPLASLSRREGSKYISISV